MTVTPGDGPVGTHVVLDGGDCWYSPSDPHTYLLFGNEFSDGSGVGTVGSDTNGLGPVAMPGNRFHLAYTIPASIGMYQTTGGGPVVPGTYAFQNLVASCAVTFVVTSRTDTVIATACPDVDFTPAGSDIAGPVLVTGVDCNTAAAVVLALRACPSTCGTDARRYDRSQYVALDFRCAGGPETQPPGGGMSWVAYLCTSDSQRVSFNKH